MGSAGSCGQELVLPPSTPPDTAPAGVVAGEQATASPWTAAASRAAAVVAEAPEAARRCLQLQFHRGLADGDEEGSDEDGEVEGGQEHVYTFKGSLSLAEVAELQEQMSHYPNDILDKSLIGALEWRQHLEQEIYRFQPPRILNWDQKIAPKLEDGANYTRLLEAKSHWVAAWRQAGLELLERGQVCLVILAGGDGARLSGGRRDTCFGYFPPTGMLDIGLLSRKSIFQLYCERLQRLEHLCARWRTRYVDQVVETSLKFARKKGFISSNGTTIYPQPKRIPLYVMTNKENRQEIEGFFREHHYFGLDSADCFFLSQESWPLFDTRGKVLMQSAHRLLLRPCGSGGVLQALARGGAVADMKARGVQTLYIVSSDNLLAKVLDPTFVGHCALMDVQVGLKTIERGDGHEPLGLYTTHKGEFRFGSGHDDVETVARPFVLEAYEVPTKFMVQRRANNKGLHFFAGNLLQYYMKLDAAEEAASRSCRWHAIDVRAPHFCIRRRAPVRPPRDSCNAFRLETLMSDALALQKQAVALHVDRQVEYAPVKSRRDAFSAVHTLAKTHQAWIYQAGGHFAGEPEANDSRPLRCEVSPLVSYEGEDLMGCFQSNGDVKLPLHLFSRTEPKHGRAEPMPEASSKEAVLKYSDLASASQQLEASEAQRERQLQHMEQNHHHHHHHRHGHHHHSDAPRHAQVQFADEEEQLPPTPRWLIDQRDLWLKKAKNANVRVQDEEENEHQYSKRDNALRRRIKTIAQRPDKDEGDEEAVSYGTVRYHCSEAEQGMLDSIDEMQQRKAADAKEFGDAD